jgi:hypothetical protein
MSTESYELTEIHVEVAHTSKKELSEIAQQWQHLL